MEEILITEKSDDYELLDCGGGEKLERFGKVVLSRPDSQAIWKKSLADTEWKKAHAVYNRVGNSGKWKTIENLKQPWTVSLDDLTFQLQLLPSKHVGLFPEQAVQWDWLSQKIKSRISPKRSEGTESNKASATTVVTVLNLFGYTGGATLACAKAGGSVCHVDASKFAVDLANTNMKASGLGDRPIRLIVDDVRKFVEREIKRGNKYDVIILDPPVYGRGAKGESWKIEEDLVPLLSRVKEIISSNPLCILLNGYSSIYSHITYSRILDNITSDLKGKISGGELAIKESSGGRLLPCGIFSKWEI